MPVKKLGMGELRHVLQRLPAYVRLVWALGRDHRLTPGQRAIIALAAGYGISPVDLLPGLVPVVGQLDDLLVLLGALRRVLRRLPPAPREEHLRAAGMSLGDIDADYHCVRNALRHVVARTVRLGGRVGRRGIRITGRAVSLGIRTGSLLLRRGLRLVSAAFRRPAPRT